MKKVFEKKLILFLSLFMISTSAQGSYLWDINYGIEIFRNLDFKNANSFFKNYVLSNPNDKNGYYWLAKTYWELKNSSEAKENFKKAYELTLEEKNIEKIEFNIDDNTTLEDYFDMALAYFEDKNFSEAQIYADMMLKVNPKSPSAYFIKAKIAQLENKEQEAIDYLNKAILFNNKLIKTNLAKSLNITQLPEISQELYAIFALENYFSSDINSAIKYFQKYLAINPNDYDMSNLLVDLYIKNNDLNLAQVLLDEIKKNDLNNIQSLLYQAEIYKLQNDENLFLKTLLEANKINPNNQEVLLKLGNYYLTNKNYFEANKYFETLINVNDEFYEGYFGYIYSLSMLGKTDEAISYIRKIADVNLNENELSFLLAQICYVNGDYNEALAYINEAIKKLPHEKFYEKRAEIYTILKKYPEAIEDWKIVLKTDLSPEDIEKIKEKIAWNYLKLNDIKKAREYINIVTTFDNESLIYKYNLYVLYKLQSNNEQALKLKRQIKKFKPSQAQDYIDLSKITYEQTGFSSAVEILNKGVKKGIFSSELYLEMIKLYSLENNKGKIKLILEQMQIPKNN